jgi:prephenate dehydrogenase
MKILVLGAGNMGAFFIDTLCLEHDVAVYDSNMERMKYLFRTRRIETYEQIREFNPDLLINAVSLQYTKDAFEKVLPYISELCIISDIASVKNGLSEYYSTLKHRFVSSHPMFGPTFANIKDLSDQSAVIIKESDPFGKAFFRDFYSRLKINIYEYSFDEHDKTMAYSLSIPFTASFVFGACMQKMEAPGTTFRKHMSTVKGVMSENDYLLSEIMMNPYTLPLIENIKGKLTELTGIINNRDTGALHQFFTEIRKNIS